MVYHCTLIKEDNMFIAQFPDMPNVLTGGFSHEGALALAKDALDSCLECDIEYGAEIPPPSFKDGWPVEVASHIAIAIQAQKRHCVDNQTSVAV